MAVERVEIGFLGGQVLAARLDESAMKDLRSALESGSGWYDLAAEDGPVSLDLAKVVFMRSGSGEHRVGFITES